MSVKCKHDLAPRSCATCQQATERESLPENPLREIIGGQIAFVLRLLDGGNRAKILRIKVAPAITEVPVNELRSFKHWNAEFGEVFQQIWELVLTGGHLFLPHGPLTDKEQRDLGPSRCYQCQTLLSLTSGVLGCTECRYYVCRCGRCLCGYTGWNYMRQPFSQQPPLPISREDRVEYIRVVRYLRYLLGV
jgi:hypothetical protein